MSCTPFTIDDVSEEMITKIILGLENLGAKVTGANPWHVNLNQHGIQLDAEWLPTEERVQIRTTDKSFYVSCGQIENQLRNEIEKVRPIN